MTHIKVARHKRIPLFTRLGGGFLNPEPPFYLYVNRWYASGNCDYRLSKRTDCGGLDGWKISRESATLLLKVMKEIE